MSRSRGQALRTHRALEPEPHTPHSRQFRYTCKMSAQPVATRTAAVEDTEEARVAAVTAIDEVRVNARRAAQHKYETGPGRKRPRALLELDEKHPDKKKSRKLESAYVSRYNKAIYEEMLEQRYAKATSELKDLENFHAATHRENQELKDAIKYIQMGMKIGAASKAEPTEQPSPIANLDEAATLVDSWAEALVAATPAANHTDATDSARPGKSEQHLMDTRPVRFASDTSLGFLFRPDEVVPVSPVDSDRTTASVFDGEEDLTDSLHTDLNSLENASVVSSISDAFEESTVRQAANPTSNVPACTTEHKSSSFRQLEFFAGDDTPADVTAWLFQSMSG